MANLSRSIPKVGDGPLMAPFSAAATPDLDAELQLAGTVPHYERHVFLCYKGPHAWPTKIEDPDTAGLPGRLAAAIEARQALKTTKFTICEGKDGSELSNGDILVFPDMVQYKGLTCSFVNDFVEEVLVNGKPWFRGSRQTMSGFYVFVCCHGGMDKRCYICGPPLVERCYKEKNAQGLGKVTVSACSHVGGNRYAGNVIIFGPDATGQVAGHWKVTLK